MIRTTIASFLMIAVLSGGASVFAESDAPPFTGNSRGLLSSFSGPMNENGKKKHKKRKRPARKRAVSKAGH
jgi:hypothetical protein